MKLLSIAACAAVALAGTSMRAEACNPLLNKNYGKHVAGATLPASMLARNHAGARTSSGIVGMWHDVRTASDGSLFMEGFDTWSRDGTEYELANFAPATGAMCVGVWQKNGKIADLTTHVAWLYDLNNNFVGTLNLSQPTKVSADGNGYTGAFDAKFYDPNGNLFQEVTGTAAGERLVQ
jgi:hypothetical protein